MSFEKRGEAIDLSHHLSDVARARNPSPLKDMMKYLGRPGVISLVGGLPNENYFPISSVSGEILVPDSFPLEDADKPSSSLSWFWRLFGKSSPAERTTPFTVHRFSDNDKDLTLATSLQYSMAKGLPQLMTMINEFTEKVYRPAYSNYATGIDLGNTDGIQKSILTLCNPGEGVFFGEWTYPSTINTIKPYGIHPVPLKMDSQGIRSDDLRDTLSGWDESVRGMPRPHVLYTIPVGQNPTGVTVGYERKKEIYGVCVDFDVIIIEDDPYYFLQAGPYVPKSDRRPDPLAALSDEEYIARLAPSYLRLDYQGRVIRLDSFSKNIAPGSRLGWATCNPLFAERLERATETSTQAPCGFGQIFVTSTLLQWKYEGYIRWLKGLRSQYKGRRDDFVDCLAEQFSLRETVRTEGHLEGCTVYEASLRAQNIFVDDKTPHVAVLSFVPPTSGMFVWLEVHFENHPLFGTLETTTLEMKLWTDLAEAGLVLGPGYLFSATRGENASRRRGHFRVSFSQCSLEEMKKSSKILSSVFREFMKLKSITVV
ncbi:hypothetical protein V5O48_002456 [Marasmius crinis-equi]|uniref:Aminotransferase class I/classII large domain-containing protein n=1 Tax=Marasmius crinis-equi TaxID=585013 RepID=A0ABR3FWA4_9AGAR